MLQLNQNQGQIEIINFEGNPTSQWQNNNNDIKQSQQLSPSFKQNMNRQSITDDSSIANYHLEGKTDTYQYQGVRRGGGENNTLDQQVDQDIKLEVDKQSKKLNKQTLQTLNNSIDKLFCCDPPDDDNYDMNQFVLYRNFQSDSKANSKYGSKRDSKQETPKYTPRFNLHPPEILLQNQDVQTFQKPRKNASNCQSYESFCFKEDRNGINYNPNSHYDQKNINNLNSLYEIQGYQNGYDYEQIWHDSNNYYPYMIYQQNGKQQIEEEQQQLNSYHLPQQKKKKIMMSSNFNNVVQQNGQSLQKSNTSNFYPNQLNKVDQANHNKQITMVAMIAQIQHNQKQQGTNKIQLSKNDKCNSVNSNGRVCQTEPSPDDIIQSNAEFISRYNEALAHIENSYVWDQKTKQQQQLQFANNTNQLRNISQSRKVKENKIKAINGNEDQEDITNMKEYSSFNDEESYVVEQMRQNMISEQLQFMQQNHNLSFNPKHNNYINQKLYSDQMSKLKKQVNIQQQYNTKSVQRPSIEGIKLDHQSKNIKRVNTNPNGIGQSQQKSNYERASSGDKKLINKIANLSNSKNQMQINGDSNKQVLQSKSGLNWNENTKFNLQQRKFRQMSAHLNSQNYRNNNFQIFTEGNKNNHQIDEDYNNEVFQKSDQLHSDQQSGSQLNNSQKISHNFVKSQSRDKYQSQQDQNYSMQQTSQFQKKQTDQKNIQNENNLIINSVSQDKQSLKKRIQEFDKKKSINLNQLPLAQNVTQIQLIAQTSSAMSISQQVKKNSSLLRKKKKQQRSSSPKNIDSILEVSKGYENTGMTQQNRQNTQNNVSQEKKKVQVRNKTNGNNQELQNQTNSSSSGSASNDFDQYNFQKYVCKTEGDDSQSSLKVANPDESDSNRNTKTQQDYQQLSTSASSTNKFNSTIQNQQQESSLSQTKSANSNLFAKSGKRIQSANYNSNRGYDVSNALQPQLSINQVKSLLDNQAGTSQQQVQQHNKNNEQRGRFNSNHPSNFQQYNLSLNNTQQLTKRINIGSSSQTTTNNSQQNSIANTLLKNQHKKRSYTPLSTNVNTQSQQPQLKDFFLNQKEQFQLSRNNINKQTLNQKVSQSNEKEQFHIMHPPTPISFQQLLINTQFISQQNNNNSQQQQVFPNLQKQQAKRNEIAGLHNLTTPQNQQIQYQQQRPQSRQGLAQNQTFNINQQQWLPQKSKQINNNPILNQTLTSKLNKV